MNTFLKHPTKTARSSINTGLQVTPKHSIQNDNMPETFSLPTPTSVISKSMLLKGINSHHGLLFSGQKRNIFTHRTLSDPWVSKKGDYNWWFCYFFFFFFSQDHSHISALPCHRGRLRMLWQQNNLRGEAKEELLHSCKDYRPWKHFHFQKNRSSKAYS